MIYLLILLQFINILLCAFFFTQRMFLMFAFQLLIMYSNSRLIDDLINGNAVEDGNNE